MARAEYSSLPLSRRRPWLEWDISRSTWFRRRSLRERARMQALIERLGPSEKRALIRLLTTRRAG